MKTNTINKLDAAATALSDAFVADVQMGYTTREMCASDKAKHKCGSDIEFIKFTIRKDKHVIDHVFRQTGVACDICNVCKTMRQFNYLANEIVYRLRSSKNRAAAAVAFGSRRK